MYNIIISPLATETYQQNILFLEHNWSTKEVVDFINKVSDVVAILKIEPQTFQKWEKDNNVHKVEIVKQITLYYQINNNGVELLLFFNNYQNPTVLQKFL